MYELPLFPLNTVLFPGTPVRLHIFEERYKAMINRCVESRQPFGVVLIKEGQEAQGGLAEPHLIGCTADIQQLQPLPQGRMNIIAMGKERFRIVSLKHDRPYLVGVVEPYPMSNISSASHFDLIEDELRELVNNYLEILARVQDVDLSAGQLPDDTLKMAFTAAALIQIPAVEKQALLASDLPNQLLSRTRNIYYKEVTLLRTIPSGSQGAFSFN